MGAEPPPREEKKEDRTKQGKASENADMKRQETASIAGYMGAVDCDVRLLVAVGGVCACGFCWLLSVCIILSRKADCDVC